jgi:sarcosine oxidase, subunit delta
MMQIRCPWCGMRDEPEFAYGGAASVARPPLEASDEQWGDYLFFRDNPKGILQERWHHAYGCGQWFNVSRHTVTHEILSIYGIGERAP